MSLPSAETNGQYLPTQMYNAAWIPPRNRGFFFDLTLSPAPLLMLQLFYCTFSETLPLTRESSGGQRGITITIIAPLQGIISLAVGRSVCLGGRSVWEWGGRVAPLQVHQEGTAGARWVLLQSHGWQFVLLKEQKSFRLPVESEQERNASLTVILLLSCSRARKYYW